MNTGLSLIDAIHYPPTVPECRNRQDCYACPIEQCSQAVRTHEAVRLIQAGARTTLVYQLTDLPKKYVKRLYLQLMGQPSPRGMMPFTDAQYSFKVILSCSVGLSAFRARRVSQLMAVVLSKRCNAAMDADRSTLRASL